jgi:hypothetical protein
MRISTISKLLWALLSSTSLWAQSPEAFIQSTGLSYPEGALGQTYVVDTDLDGVREVWTVTQTKVFAFEPGGGQRPGFPVSLPPVTSSPSNFIRGGMPAFGDLNGDGQLEIVLVVGGANELVASSSRIVVLRNDGQSLPGWPQPAPLGTTFVDRPVIARNGAENVIVVPNRMYNSSPPGSVTRRVMVYRGDGSQLPTATLVPPAPFASSNEVGLAVGDVDNDGIDEIAALTRTALFLVRLTTGNIQFSLATLNQGSSSGFLNIYPAMGDINGDGFMDIVASDYTGSNAAVRVVNRFGNHLPGWPYFIPNAYYSGRPALADVTGDGRLEVALEVSKPNQTEIHLITHVSSGPAQPAPGWPVTFPYRLLSQFMTAVDLTADSRSEVIVRVAEDEVATPPFLSSAEIRVYRHNGVMHRTVPFTLFPAGVQYNGTGAVVANDLRQDGDVEYSFGSEAVSTSGGPPVPPGLSFVAALAFPDTFPTNEESFWVHGDANPRNTRAIRPSPTPTPTASPTPTPSPTPSPTVSPTPGSRSRPKPPVSGGP